MSWATILTCLNPCLSGTYSNFLDRRFLKDFVCLNPCLSGTYSNNLISNHFFLNSKLSKNLNGLIHTNFIFFLVFFAKVHFISIQTQFDWGSPLREIPSGNGVTMSVKLRRLLEPTNRKRHLPPPLKPNDNLHSPWGISLILVLVEAGRSFDKGLRDTGQVSTKRRELTVPQSRSHMSRSPPNNPWYSGIDWFYDINLRAVAGYLS